MIKRIVILQDESLVVQELARGPRWPRPLPPRPRRRRPRARRSAPPACRAAPRAAQRRHGARRLRAVRQERCPRWRCRRRLAVAVLDEPPPAAPTAAPTSLAEVAKSAALKAERAAIEDALHRVHWNRRKAAEQLGVSYKTLLNKIKECGISRN